MISWFKAFFAFLFGRKAGQEDQRSADVEKTNVVAQKIVAAQAAAPDSNAELVGRLRKPGGGL